MSRDRIRYFIKAGKAPVTWFSTHYWTVRECRNHMAWCHADYWRLYRIRQSEVKTILQASTDVPGGFRVVGELPEPTEYVREG